MDQYSFIPTDSCHHRSWLKSVPHSQFLRLRRNCTDVDTYVVQASILKQRFIEKGYDELSLNSEIQQVAMVNRCSLLTPKPPRESDNTYKCSMLTTFFVQHKEIKNIINRRWGILKNDHILETLLPE